MQKRDTLRATRALGPASIHGMHGETAVHHLRDEKGRFRHADEAVAALAEKQHGVVARWQLVAMGLRRGEIDGRLARGTLHSVRRGVYAVGHRALRREGHLMAAVLSIGPDAALSHRSAAALWQLLPPASGLVELTCPRPLRSRQGIRVHHSPLPADEVTLMDGLPVTEVARTIFDLAAVARYSQVENACNEAEVRGLTSRRSIPELLERYPGRRGAAVLRERYERENGLRGITREELEKRFAAVLAETDLPRPRRNAHVAVDGRFFEVDCLWAEQRLIVELDGRAAHGTRLAFESDRERDRLLLVEGWQVVRITWRQLHDDADRVVADLRRLLRKGSRTPTL